MLERALGEKREEAGRWQVMASAGNCKTLTKLPVFRLKKWSEDVVLNVFLLLSVL